MASLKLKITHIFFVGWIAWTGSSIARASLPGKIAPSFAKLGSIRAIHHCRWSQASFWGNALEQNNSEAATLYRLAWLQVSRGAFSSREVPTFDPDRNWAWKMDFSSKEGIEVWKDEVDAYPENIHCGANDSSVPQSYSELEQEVLDSILFPYLNQPLPKSPNLRQVLLEYLLYRRYSGKASPVDFRLSQRDLDSLSHLEACSWKIWTTLDKTDRESTLGLETLLDTCSDFSSSYSLWLDSLAHIQVGDLRINQGDYAQAFQHYKKALKSMSEENEAASLRYRVAASALLSGASDDLSLRLAYSLLLENSDLSPTFKSNIQTLICEKFSTLQPLELRKLISRVFKERSIVKTSIELTSACSQPEFYSFWKSLESIPMSHHEIGQLYGILLSSSLSHRNIPKAKRYTLALAQLSFRLPYGANRAFWSSIEHHPGQTGFELAKLYLSSSHQDLQVNADRLKRLHQRVSFEAQSDFILKAESKRAKEPITIPLFNEVPEFKLKKDIPVRFIDHFYREISGELQSQ